MADFDLHAEVGPPMDGEMVHHKVPYPTGYDNFTTFRTRRRAVDTEMKPHIVALDPSSKDSLSIQLPGFGGVLHAEGEVEGEAKKLIGDMIPKEYGIMVVRQTEGRTNGLFVGKLPLRENPTKEVVLGDDVEPWSTRKRKLAVAMASASGRAKVARPAKAATLAPSEDPSDADDAEDVEVESEAEADDQGDDYLGEDAMDTNATACFATSESLGFVLSVLKANGCEHVTAFPQMFIGSFPRIERE
uniref:Uncharacterized protein n=1 Tax=Oryza barthii TaxID=65489 RepID=A0A0D3HKI1_9ORYZ